ncbi:hypothetical protein INR49_003567 [Caranx melampygus]|nr:hypothetical protein INR49_003567 [Caranx melampygus]
MEPPLLHRAPPGGLKEPHSQAPYRPPLHPAGAANGPDSDDLEAEPRSSVLKCLCLPLEEVEVRASTIKSMSLEPFLHPGPGTSPSQGLALTAEPQPPGAA